MQNVYSGAARTQGLATSATTLQREGTCQFSSEIGHGRTRQNVSLEL